MIFLITIFISFLGIKQVYAESFYEAEYIDNIYLSKYIYSTHMIHYQKARFFRKTGTNEIAYCIEPFRFFVDNSIYQQSTNIENLSQEQMNRIKLISYFGYGYQNHQEQKWYAITQYMIWKEVDQINGEVYFTEGLNGKKIEPYESEIQEIEQLIQNYNKKLNIEDKVVYLIEGRAMNIYVGENLKNYTVISNEFKTNGEYLIPKTNILEGDYKITFQRKEQNYEKPILFYQSSNSQNLMEVGNLETKEIISNIKVVKTKIIINKVDEDTNTNISQGNASLDGATITLYDSRNKKINDYVVINKQIIIEDLDIGTYFIEEKKAGVGYHINPNRLQVSITLDDSKKEISLTNKVISKKIKIIKEYGEENKLNREANIEFEIYDKNNNYLKTISTNQEGEIEIELPYGEYRIIQKTTTPGYKEVDPFIIKVEDEDEEIIELKDYRIMVPNTIAYKKTIIDYILSLMRIIIC